MTKKKPNSHSTSSQMNSNSRPDSTGSPSQSSAGAEQPGSKKSMVSRLLAIVVAVVIVLAGGYYYLTGADPLGLFQPDQTPAAVITAQVPTHTTASEPMPTRRARTDWWEVYFTDPQNVNDPNNLQGSIPEKLIEYIDAATSTIHIAAFEFDLVPVAEALIKAQERGIEVQWVTDDEYGIEKDKESGRRLFPMLTKAGIKVRDDGRTALMHNKFWIFDEQTVWTGSTNITVNGNFRNNNNVLVLHSPDVAAIYETEFTEMWRKDFGPTSPSSVRLQQTAINRTPVQVLFAPEDKVISRLIPLVENAKSSIHLMAFSFTHVELGAAMRARAEAGVDVKGIFETRASETEHSELSTLYCAQVPVRQDGNPGTFHHKVIVIDEETVITGSLNFSANADGSNDENIVIITSRSIANQYLREFGRRWDEGSDPDPAAMQCPQ